MRPRFVLPQGQRECSSSSLSRKRIESRGRYFKQSNGKTCIVKIFISLKFFLVTALLFISEKPVSSLECLLLCFLLTVLVVAFPFYKK